MRPKTVWGHFELWVHYNDSVILFGQAWGDLRGPEGTWGDLKGPLGTLLEKWQKSNWNAFYFYFMPISNEFFQPLLQLLHSSISSPSFSLSQLVKVIFEFNDVNCFYRWVFSMSIILVSRVPLQSNMTIKHKLQQHSAAVARMICDWNHTFKYRRVSISTHGYYSLCLLMELYSSIWVKLLSILMKKFKKCQKWANVATKY